MGHISAKYCSSAVQFFDELSGSLENTAEGELFHFRVTILQAVGIPRDFTDIFVQFRYCQFPLLQLLEAEGKSLLPVTSPVRPSLHAPTLPSSSSSGSSTVASAPSQHSQSKMTGRNLLLVTITCKM